MSFARIVVYGQDTVSGNYVPLTVTSGSLIVAVSTISGASAAVENWSSVFGTSTIDDADIPVLGAAPFIYGAQYNASGGADAGTAYAQRGNCNWFLFTDQVRSGNQAATIMRNPSWRIASFYITVSALANPVTPIIETAPDILFSAGQTVTLLTGAAIAAPGSVTLELNPYKVAVANLSAQVQPPLYMRFRYTTTGNASVQCWANFGL